MIAIRTSLAERLIVAAFALLAYVQIAACMRALPTEAIEPRTQPWCVSMRSKTGETATLCVERRRTCERSAAAARRYGALGGIVSVDACGYRGER